MSSVIGFLQRLLAIPFLLFAAVFILPVVIPYFLIRRGLLCARRAGGYRRISARPSFTAEGVAIYRAALARTGNLSDPATYELLDWDARLLVAFAVWLLFVTKGKFGVLGTSIQLRTLEIDDFVTRKQPLQVVILGAGLDARAYRMGRLLPPHTVFFEVDVPTTQQLKLTLLERARRRAPQLFTSADGTALQEGRVKFVSCDFSTNDSFMDRLRDAGFDLKNSRTVFIIEGVTMYLEFQEVKATMESISSVCAAGTAVAVQVQGSPSAAGSTLARRLSENVGEKWKWGIRQDETPLSVFGPMGFEVEGTASMIESSHKRFPDENKRRVGLSLSQIVFLLVKPR